MIIFSLEPAQILQLLAGTVFPLLVGLITSRDTRPHQRAILLALLSVLTSLAAELAVALQSGRPYDLMAGLLAGLVSFLIAVGMHFGIWKPTGLAAVMQGIGTGQASLPAQGPAAAPQAPQTVPAAPGALPSYQADPTVGPSSANVFVHVFPPAGADQAAVADSVAAAVTVAAPAATVAAPVIHDPSEAFSDPSRPAS